jgi:hypothetical protein
MQTHDLGTREGHRLPPTGLFGDAGPGASTVYCYSVLVPDCLASTPVGLVRPAGLPSYLTVRSTVAPGAGMTTVADRTGRRCNFELQSDMTHRILGHSVHRYTCLSHICACASAIIFRHTWTTSVHRRADAHNFRSVQLPRFSALFCAGAGVLVALLPDYCFPGLKHAADLLRRYWYDFGTGTGPQTTTDTDHTRQTRYAGLLPDLPLVPLRRTLFARYVLGTGPSVL